MVKKIKELFQSVQSKRGSYSVALIAVVAAIVIVLNLILGLLPNKIKKVDISDNNLYTISKTSKKMLKNLDDKIVLNMIGEKDNIDERIKTYVEKYAALSKKVTVTWTDPVLHPSILKKDGAENNSVVVSSKETGKTKTIPFTDMIVFDESAYYTTGSATEKEFDAEGQLTSAIDYVTNTVTKKIYTVSGHGEAAFSESVQDLLEKSNLKTEELNLMMDASIPEDCELLFLNAPTSDLSEDEQKVISDYLEKGGKVYIVLGDAKDYTPNLQKLLRDYGLNQAKGYIADMERNYQGNYYYIFPKIQPLEKVTDSLSTKMVMLANALGMVEIEPAKESREVTPFMQTSENGFAVTEEAQDKGTYILGAVVTDSEEKDSRLTVVSSESLIEEGLTEQLSSLENLDLFMNSVTSNFKDVDNISIKAKSLAMTYNTIQYAGLYSLFVIFGIPLIVLTGGFVTWMKRRKA